MTHPVPAARHDGAGAPRSPFTGSDVCAAAGLPIVPGGRTVMFDQDAWHFDDVAGLPAYLPRTSIRLDFTIITEPRWRLVAKEYIYARLAPADPVVAVLPGGNPPQRLGAADHVALPLLDDGLHRVPLGRRGRGQVMIGLHAGTVVGVDQRPGRAVPGLAVPRRLEGGADPPPVHLDAVLFDPRGLG